MKNVYKYSPVALVGLLLLVFTVSFTRGAKPIIPAVKTQKCFIVSDIHFSPLFGASIKDTVLKKQLEHWNFDEWEKYFEGFPAQMAVNANLLLQDANYGLLKSALANMKKKLPNPAFILIAGDFIWHNATPADSILKKKTILFIARLFKQDFPNTLILPTMGNNDTYGQDYALQDREFLHDFASAWEPNLPGYCGDSLKARGYYACEKGNMKFMVINSALVNNGTKYPQAGAMLKWVERNLANANGKNIWIMMHIPPGINSYNDSNFWNADDTREFVSTIVKFAPSVKLMIGSHTHFDDFKVVYDGSKDKKPVALVRIVPSICANHGNFPSFEVAEFNPTSGEMVNEVNYYVNLLKTPRNTAPQQVVWADSLNDRTNLDLAKINAASFSNLITEIKTDKTGQLLKRYINFYTVGNNADSAVTINHKNYLKYLKADSLK